MSWDEDESILDEQDGIDHMQVDTLAKDLVATELLFDQATQPRSTNLGPPVIEHIEHFERGRKRRKCPAARMVGSRMEAPKSVDLSRYTIKYTAERIGQSGRWYGPDERVDEPWEWVGGFAVTDFDDYYGEWDPIDDNDWMVDYDMLFGD